MKNKVLLIFLLLLLNITLVLSILPPPPPPPTDGSADVSDGQTDDLNYDPDSTSLPDGNAEFDAEIEDNTQFDDGVIDINTINDKVADITNNQEEIIARLDRAEAKLDAMSNAMSVGFAETSATLARFDELASKFQELTKLSPLSSNMLPIVIVVVVLLLIFAVILILRSHKHIHGKYLKQLDNVESQLKKTQSTPIQQINKVNPALKNYISQSLRRGYNGMQIKSMLINQGWNAEEVNSALKSTYMPN